MKFGDIISAIEQENMVKIHESEEVKKYTENYFKRLDELITEANRLYGKSS